jgi:hypothetical protein
MFWLRQQELVLLRQRMRSGTKGEEKGINFLKVPKPAGVWAPLFFY